MDTQMSDAPIEEHLAQPFRFLDLPAELRNNISSLALGTNENIHIGAAAQTPALLSTCRQVRDEATSLYYSTNTFCIRQGRCAQWLVSRSPQVRALLRSIRLVRVFDGFCLRGGKDDAGLSVLEEARRELEPFGLLKGVRLEIGIVGAGHTIWYRDE